MDPLKNDNMANSFLRVKTRSSNVNLALDEDHNSNVQQDTIDGYWSKLIKMIPMEALAIYPVGKSVAPESWWSVWPLVCIGLIVVVRMILTRSDKGTPQTGNLFISLISFVIWVYLNGDYILMLKLDDAHRFLAFWTFLIWVPVSTFLYKGEVVE